MERKKQLSLVLPDFLVEPFYEELERMSKRNQAHLKTQFVIKALANQLKVDIPKSEEKNTSDPIETRKKVRPEDLAARMERDKNYNLTQLVTLSGLSRTTVRNLIEDSNEWFGTDGPWREKFYLKKEVTRPKQTEKRKKRRKKKTTDKPNVEAVSGPKRDIAMISTEESDKLIEMLDAKIITDEEYHSYQLRYYEEDTESWRVYDDEEKRLYLPQREKVIKKIQKLLNS